jgi:hypothetical protein
MRIWFGIHYLSVSGTEAEGNRIDYDVPLVRGRSLLIPTPVE